MVWLRLVPDKTQIPFMKYRRFTLSLSGILILLTAVVWGMYGFNFGIDFTGGTLIEAKQKTGKLNVGSVRQLMSSAGMKEVHVQEFSGTNVVQLRIAGQVAQDLNQSGPMDMFQDILGDEFEIRSLEVIGPAISNELKRDAIIAIIVSMFLVLIYLWFRFEWQYAVGAVLTTFHDVVITLGFMIIFGVPFNLHILAAILTIIGYSLNDTIVIYDRIREVMRNHGYMALSDIIDLSINQTLARTIVTSVTISIPAIALFMLGGESLSGFSLIMVFGILVGTYSSAVISAPMLIMLDLPRGEGDDVDVYLG